MNLFYSILFRSEVKNRKEVSEAPDFFIDLNLDQIVDAITAGKEEYNLKPFFYTSLSDTDSIKYRQEIMLDIEKPSVLRHITSFAEGMQNVRKQLSVLNRLYYRYHKEHLFMDVVNIYCEEVITLENHLSLENLSSSGFLSFRLYLKNYLQSTAFKSLIAEIKRIKNRLSEIKYCIRIKDLKVQIKKYESEPEYGNEIEKTFARFRQEEVKNYSVGFTHPLEMNHVEAQILDGVAQLHPDIFSQLDTFYSDNQSFMNNTIVAFDREIQFYISYLEHITILKKTGLIFCYPQVSNTNKEVYCYDSFDLALANKIINHKSSVVVNDFYLKSKERILVVSGPNQSGKTTFARTFGQLHFLASIGCPVPGSESKLFLFDNLFTHFEKQENIKNLRGKLEDDLYRINEILSKSTPSSIIIINEIFTSTTLQDAIFLGKKIMQKLIDLDLMCVMVSFIDELASFNIQTVSMTGTVDPENPDLRTYKIIRKPADGLAYALSIAKKYHLTYDCLKERIKA